MNWIRVKFLEPSTWTGIMLTVMSTAQLLVPESDVVIGIAIPVIGLWDIIRREK